MPFVRQESAREAAHLARLYFEQQVLEVRIGQLGTIGEAIEVLDEVL